MPNEPDRHQHAHPCACGALIICRCLETPAMELKACAACIEAATAKFLLCVEDFLEDEWIYELLKVTYPGVFEVLQKAFVEAVEAKRQSYADDLADEATYEDLDTDNN